MILEGDLRYLITSRCQMVKVALIIACDISFSCASCL